MVINNLGLKLELSAEYIRQLSNRHLGVGFDQLLLLEPSQQADFRFRYFNADGGEAEQCGNGARCLARFAVLNQLIDTTHFTAETAAGIMHVKLDGDLVSVSLGKATIKPKVTITTGQGDIAAIPLELGNPHAVITVDDLATIDVDLIGTAFNQAAEFPDGVNVSFLQTLSPQQIKLRIFERGVGETQACGSGAAAACCAGLAEQFLTSPVTVQMPGGTATVYWDKVLDAICLSGPATLVFTGEL